MKQPLSNNKINVLWNKVVVVVSLHSRFIFLVFVALVMFLVFFVFVSCCVLNLCLCLHMLT